MTKVHPFQVKGQALITFPKGKRDILNQAKQQRHGYTCSFYSTPCIKGRNFYTETCCKMQKHNHNSKGSWWKWQRGKERETIEVKRRSYDVGSWTKRAGQAKGEREVTVTHQQYLVITWIVCHPFCTSSSSSSLFLFHTHWLLAHAFALSSHDGNASVTDNGMLTFILFSFLLLFEFGIIWSASLFNHHMILPTYHLIKFYKNRRAENVSGTFCCDKNEVHRKCLSISKITKMTIFQFSIHPFNQ